MNWFTDCRGSSDLCHAHGALKACSEEFKFRVQRLGLGFEFKVKGLGVVALLLHDTADCPRFALMEEILHHPSLRVLLGARFIPSTVADGCLSKTRSWGFLELRGPHRAFGKP